MKRLLLVAALALAAALPTVAVAAGGGIDLTEARGSAFPNRAFVLGLPGSRVLSTDSLQVTENGNAVADLTLIPASQVGRQTFGVVLVIDASESMVGRPLRNAMAAARQFVSRRNPNQQIAVVTFNGKPNVLLPFSSSPTRIASALSHVPRVAYGTHIYDAVARAEALIAAAKIQSGSILVLSDGADTGSVAKGSDVASAARTAHVKLYTVGLQSRRFDPSTLQALALGGGGEYALARSTDQLAPLFDQLSQRLANEYVLRYKSLAGPGVKVRVHVRVAGLGSAQSAYKTPALPVHIVAPYRPSVASRVSTSPVIMILLALIVAGGVGLVAVRLFEPRRSGLPARMAEFVSVPGLQSHARQGALAASPGDAEIPDQPPGFWQRFDQALEIAQIRTSGVSLVASTVLATAVAYLLIDLAKGPWWALLALLVPVGVREWAVRKLARRRNQFAEQLPDTLQVISSALRSGHSLAGALAVVVESAAEPMKTEMQRVVADEQLGVPLEDALSAVAKRMDNRDLEQVRLVAELQRETGGNSAEVVDRVAETVRERFELRRLVKTLTVQGRMSGWIVSALPVAILLILQVINPHYIHPLFIHTAGKILFGFAVALCVAGSLVIRKIVDIKV